MSLLDSIKIASRRGPLVHLVRPYQILRSVMRDGSMPSPQEKQGIISCIREGQTVFESARQWGGLSLLKGMTTATDKPDCRRSLACVRCRVLSERVHE